jgi:hypothetical protein
MIKKIELPDLQEPTTFKTISWNAILIGAFIGTGLSILISLLSTVLGLTAFNLTQDGSIVFAAGGFFGIIIGVMCSMFAGGYAAGYLGWIYNPRRMGMIYGFSTWSVTLILIALISGHVNSYLTTYSNKISNSVFVVTEEQENATEQIIVSSTPTSIANDQKTIKISATPESLALGELSVFISFLVGALASCLGAKLSMNRRHLRMSLNPSERIESLRLS